MDFIWRIFWGGFLLEDFFGGFFGGFFGRTFLGGFFWEDYWEEILERNYFFTFEYEKN